MQNPYIRSFVFGALFIIGLAALIVFLSQNF